MEKIGINELYALHGVDKNKVQYMLDNQIFIQEPVPVFKDDTVPIFKDNNGHYYLADQHHRLCAWLLHKAGFDKVPKNLSIIETPALTVQVDVTNLSLGWERLQEQIENKNKVAFFLYFNEITFFVYQDATALNADKAFLTKYLKENQAFKLKTNVSTRNIEYQDVIKIINLAKSQGINKVWLEIAQYANFTNPDESLLIDFKENKLYHLYDITNDRGFYDIENAEKNQQYSEEYTEEILNEYKPYLHFEYTVIEDGILKFFKEQELFGL